MRKVFNKAIRAFRRDILKDPFLNEVKRWFADDGDNTIRLEYALNENSIVWDLGGYKGDFAAQIVEKYGCSVDLFEPVPTFFNNCVERFSGDNRIRCLQYGLADKNGTFEIGDSGDASSFLHGRRGRTINAEIRCAAEAFDELGVEHVDLLKINIEGGEFDVIPALIDHNLISRVKFLQVQFHTFAPNAYKRRDEIRERLQETHDEMWNYPFVWESWVRK